MLVGNSDEVNLYPQQMKLEGAWPGSMNNLIDSLNYGTYRIQVFNSGNKMLIYSKGFSTLFQEWQTTAEAQSIDRMFYHCLIFPFPQNTFILIIEERQWGGQFEVMYETEINPSDYFIIKESTLDLKSEDIIINGEPD